jgi:hypothetical protein
LADATFAESAHWSGECVRAIRRRERSSSGAKNHLVIGAIRPAAAEFERALSSRKRERRAISFATTSTTALGALSSLQPAPHQTSS